MNKKYLSIALTLYLFSPTDNEAVKSNPIKPLDTVHESSLEGSSFSLIELNSLHYKDSKHSKRSHSAKKESHNLAINLMNMQSVESQIVDEVYKPSANKLKDKSQNSIAESIPSSKQPWHLSQIDTVSSKTMSPDYVDNGTQTDQPRENAETGVQASQQTTTTGTQGKPEMKDKENQVDMAPTAQTESLSVITNAKSSTSSEDGTRSHSTRDQIGENTLKIQNIDLKGKNSDVKTVENQKTEDSFANTGTSASNTSVSSTNNPASNTPVTTHHYYHSTTHNNTLSPVTPQEKPAPVTKKAPETLFETDSFITNISRSISTSLSRDLPKMFTKFINEIIKTSQKNTIRTQSKAEETELKNTSSNKKSPSVYTVLDSIKKQCTYLYDSLIELAQRTGSRKRVFNIEEESSKCPNVRTRYHNLGEDSENRKRSKSRRLFRLSGQRAVKRARKAIAQPLSRVRRVAIHANKMTYNMDQNKRFSRPLNKDEQFVDFSFKRRIRNNAFVG